VTQPPYPQQPGQQPHNQRPGHQPPEQPPSGQPGSMLKFTVQGNALTSNMVPPTLTIDGYPAPAPSMGGSVMIPIRPGPHRLEAYSQWLRRYGQASLDVMISPNSTLEVFYAPPFHQFTTGSMGLSEQKRAGVGCLIAIFGIAGLCLLILIIVMIAVAVSS
jgi:hypothetical protein